MTKSKTQPPKAKRAKNKPASKTATDSRLRTLIRAEIIAERTERHKRAGIVAGEVTGGEVEELARLEKHGQALALALHEAETSLTSLRAELKAEKERSEAFRQIAHRVSGLPLGPRGFHSYPLTSLRQLAKLALADPRAMLAALTPDSTGAVGKEGGDADKLRDTKKVALGDEWERNNWRRKVIGVGPPVVMMEAADGGGWTYVGEVSLNDMDLQGWKPRRTVDAQYVATHAGEYEMVGMSPIAWTYLSDGKGYVRCGKDHSNEWTGLESLLGTRFRPINNAPEPVFPSDMSGIIERAASEEETPVSVGGLAVAVGMPLEICGHTGWDPSGVISAICQREKGHSGKHAGMGAEWNDKADKVHDRAPKLKEM